MANEEINTSIPLLDEQLRELKNKRAYSRRCLTVLSNSLDSFQYDATSQLENLINTQIIACKNANLKYEELLERFYNADEEDKFQEYFDSLTELQIKIFELGQNAINVLKVDVTQSDNNIQSSSQTSYNVNIPLPPVNIPKFGGNFHEWISFRDTFDSLVGNNNQIPKIRKFQYLQSHLFGEAADAIKGLELTAENYDVAREIIKDRFENERIIVFTHLKALFEYNSIPKENASNFRNLLDVFTKHLRALASLQRPVDKWDDLLLYMLGSKLPLSIRKEWEERLVTTKVPTFSQLKQFLTNKCNAIDACIANLSELKINDTKNNSKVSQHNKFNNSRKIVNNVATATNARCNFCNADHWSNACDELLKLSVNKRIEFVRNKKLCLNCFRAGHSAKECRSSRCKICNFTHNTLLHMAKQANANISIVNTPANHDNEVTQLPSNIVNSLSSQNIESNVLLLTCLIDIRDSKNNYHTARCLLDSGSQINIITRRFANKLKLKEFPFSLPIVSINNGGSQSNTRVETEIKSKCMNYCNKIKFHILNNITCRIPSQSFDSSLFNIPENITLADPHFNHSGEIDVLVGAELFFSLMCVGQVKLDNGIILQKSKLGWLVSGTFPATQQSMVCNLVTLKADVHNALNHDLERFWTIEQVNSKSQFSPEELRCENLFINTHERDETGRFIVRMPFKENPSCLGNSYESAKNRFLNLERKFAKNSDLKNQYSEFIHEYDALNHMKQIDLDRECTSASAYYLPHHAVFKADSLTTKIRVVFDGSQKTSSGRSLNEILMTGPVVQDELYAILLRFRCYKFVITSDISKMYRQVLIHPDDSRYQRILWRDKPDEEIKTFELKTVTYGTTSGSFLATRCLKQLADNIKIENPQLSRVITHDFYIDDLITGSDDISELVIIRDQLIDTLVSGGFQLRKWASNNPQLLKNIDNAKQENLILKHDEHHSIKTLGIHWSPNEDQLEYTTQYNMNPSRITKRTIVSCVAQIFDPVGLVSPIVTTAKLIVQELWKAGVDWDEAVPQNVHTKWLQFVTNLKYLHLITIPRKVIAQPSARIELHGFSDASQHAYGACIYVLSIHENQISSRLFTSKSRIAPIKTISLPKLELCAAVLLAQLMHKVLSSININIARCKYYTDSMITLHWIKSCPTRWKIFVSNRVGEIQMLSDPNNWYHVTSANNPSDLISRGCLSTQLASSKLWWIGPTQIMLNKSDDLALDSVDNIPEEKLKSVTCAVTIQTDNSLYTRYSNFDLLVRITGWCKRFLNNIRKIDVCKESSLTVNELHQAELTLIRNVQKECFNQDILDLSRTNSVNMKSQLLCLNPFLDETKIIRVGGRLRNSNLNFENKFPVILPANHRLTELIIQREHAHCLHGGAQLTLSRIRLKFWIISSRNAVRKILRRCVTCFKSNPHHVAPKMGDLPECRTRISRPFSDTGIDFFGPIQLKEGSRKSKRYIKAYGAIFVCMATKAVHIELVTSLTTEAFLASLRRFIARRGLVNTIYCDNATNFVGASNELKKIYDFLESESAYIKHNLSIHRILWKFNPPRAPHFGGLWEAAVKSCKRHLTRIVGNSNLTYEEMSTVFSEIESTLNSRPLMPLSNDPNDSQYLTPGHFLILGHMNSLPEVNLTNTSINRLSRWQYTQQLQQHFWKRFQCEYLGELQRRTRWQQTKGSALKVGDLVIVHDDNLPPKYWKAGRVLQLHPGGDGIARAATIKTSSDTIKRPATKLCILPIQHEC